MMILIFYPEMGRHTLIADKGFLRLPWTTIQGNNKK